MDSSPLVTRTTRYILEHTEEIIALSDGRKLSIEARHSTCSIDQMSTVITDHNVADDPLKSLRDAGVRTPAVRTELSS